jgi:hypothetical protein
MSLAIAQEVLQVKQGFAGTTYKWWDAHFDKWSEVFVPASPAATEVDQEKVTQQDSVHVAA